MILKETKANSFQRMLDATIRRDIVSSMNPQISEKRGAIQAIERYIQSIPFAQNPALYYGVNAYADRQTVKDHFCSFWKRELGLSFAERTKLEEIFEHSVTGVSQFASNSPYLIFVNEGNAISIQSMEDAIFEALDLKQQGI